MARSKQSELQKKKLRVIRAFVLEQRRRMGITELRSRGLFELSCLSFGEFYNLLWRKLIYIPEKTWRKPEAATGDGPDGGGLDDPQILNGVYRQVLLEKLKERERVAIKARA